MIESLDTNILLRYIWRDVPKQREKAIEMMDDKSRTFYISDLVLSEVIFNLKHDHLRRSTIVGVLNSLFQKKNVIVNDFVKYSVLPFYAEHPALSFVDCYAVFEAEKKNYTPLLTFDKKLANQHKNAKLV